MKVLVTGASGFIGQRLVERLLTSGHSVRALYRRERLGAFLANLANQYPNQLSLCRYDLSFPASLPALPLIEQCYASAIKEIPQNLPDWTLDTIDIAAARDLLSGCDACVHIAARVGDWGSNAEFFAANVNPLRVLLQAAQLEGLHRFVYVSSIAVHGFGHNRGSSEAGPYFAVSNPYQLSKRCGEALVNAAMVRGLDACIIRPGNVYGPGDTTTFYPIFDALRQGLMGTLSSGRYLTCPVYIDDLVGAIVAALGAITGQARTFNITSGETINWRELIDQSCDALGIRRSTLDLPGFLARGAAFVLEGSFRLARAKNPPALTRYRVEQLLHDYNFSHATASASLAYKPIVGIKHGLQSTVRAYRMDRGLVKEPNHEA